MRDAIIIYGFFIIVGVILFVVLARFAFRINTLIRNQEAQLEALITLLKQGGSSKDEIEGIRNIGKD